MAAAPPRDAGVATTWIRASPSPALVKRQYQNRRVAHLHESPVRERRARDERVGKRHGLKTRATNPARHQRVWNELVAWASRPSVPAERPAPQSLGRDAQATGSAHVTMMRQDL